MSKITSPLASLALASSIAVLLSGCLGHAPKEQDFLANASQLTSAPSCFPVNLAGDVSSYRGGLQDGWIAYADVAPVVPQSFQVIGRDEALLQANALVKVGFLAKSATQIYQNGVLVPATQYRVASAGRAALGGSTVYGGSGLCFEVGAYAAEKLIPAAEGEVAIKETKVGDQSTYSAVVQMVLKGTPAWLSTPEVRDAFKRQVTDMALPKKVAVELVDFNGTWIAKPLLSQKMGGTTGRSLEVSKVPRELEDAVLVRLGEAATRAGSRSLALQLPMNASETPRELQQKGGLFFFSKTPDAKAWTAAPVKAETLPAAAPASGTKTSGAKAMPTPPKPVTQSTAATSATPVDDRYLTHRAELQGTLDALVEVGVATRKEGTASELGTPTDGVLYTLSPGLSVPYSGIVLGTIRVTGPLVQVEQRVNNTPALSLSAKYEVLNQPAWVAKIADKLPPLAKLNGGTITGVAIASSSPTAELPIQLISAQLN